MARTSSAYSVGGDPLAGRADHVGGGDHAADLTGRGRRAGRLAATIAEERRHAAHHVRAAEVDVGHARWRATGSGTSA